jgi:hypothetical protein
VPRLLKPAPPARDVAGMEQPSGLKLEGADGGRSVEPFMCAIPAEHDPVVAGLEGSMWSYFNDHLCRCSTHVQLVPVSVLAGGCSQ